MIRFYQEGDMEEWLRMRLALWPDNTRASMLAEMQEILDDPQSATLVAVRANGSLGGFLEAGTRKYADGCDTSPVGYIEGWYVDADLRGQGMGAALVRAAETWARDLGYREMASDCLLENDVSLQAHLALGYEEMERLIHFCKKL